VAGQVVDPASVHGLKWLDENGDGVRDAGEPGLAGVTIYVDLNDNGVLDEGEPNTVSMPDDLATDLDETGMYWLEDLESGTLTIREVVPDGFVQTFPADPGSHVIDVAPNESVESVDFGNQEILPASIHGVKWVDANGDGSRDPDEPGLPGVTIYIDLNENGEFDEGEPHALTMEDDPATDFDESGLYWLEGLRPGRYVVREVVPDGFMQTFPADPGSHTVPVEFGDIVESVDFGNQEILPASIHGVKWVDANGDGSRDPDEPGLPGVTIYIDLNDNSAFDEGEPHALTMEDDPATDLDESGLYWLEGLRPGRHVIREVVPDGFMQTFPINGGEHVVELASGDIVEGLNFGNEEILPASVHGAKWSDSNGDGLRQADEPGIPGVTIYVDTNDNGVLDEDEPRTVTMEDDPETDLDETGLYWLEGLRPGAKVIREVVPDGFRQTFPTDPDAHLVELGSGEVLEGLDFGNQETAWVHGSKWLDVNGDGIRDPDEPGIPGVIIYADLNENAELDEDEPRTRTMRDNPETTSDENGQYWFTGLLPGAMLIREVVPDGFVQTFPADPDFYMVELASGESIEGLDFGNALEGHKLSLCHNGHSINVDFHSLPAHLMHGDWVAIDENACENGG
jgi:protocatechuate 3,4-dioxygenase beta subunit